VFKLVLDPGHGGRDPGAVGNGLKEKDINLDISKRVTYILSFYEVEVTLTRTADVYLSLDDRCQVAKIIQADYFCSIHSNAGGGTGFESFIYHDVPEKTVQWREILHGTVAGYCKSAGFIDRGMKRADFDVLRKTGMPAVLIENLFLDHQKDAASLKDRCFLDGLARAIADGLAVALKLPLRPQQPQEGTGKTLVKAAPSLKLAQARLFLAEKNLLAPDYIDIYMLNGAKYGIRWDVVFAQSCKETAYWRFGGQVKPEQNNFAGLASCDGKPGASFASPEEGIAAQFQHWHVYYYGGDLPAGVKKMDPRRDAVIKAGWAGALQYVEDLGGHWSSLADYGSDIVDRYLKPMLAVELSEPTPAPFPEPIPAPDPVPTQPPGAPWDPSAEIAKLQTDGLIKNEHRPDDPVTWGEMATVINRLRGR